MLLYAVLMFSVSVIFAALSMMIYRGKTDWIHSYHQARVKDKAAYGRAFGKVLLGIALAPFISGVIGLCGDSDLLAVTAVAVLLSGLALGFCGILAVQRRYNKGLF